MPRKNKKEAERNKAFCCKNEGKADRIIRMIIGIILFLISYYYFDGILKAVAYLISLILVVTAITGYCCLYRLFGFKTN